MDEDHVDALFARYVEHLVVCGSHLDPLELASGDDEVAAALRERIEAFQRVDEALGRRSQPLTGRMLARYHIQEKLGAGGMGEVYRARDLELQREVAVKVLPPIFALDPDRRSRFEREARILAALDHANVAAIHGLERADGLHFLVLELVPGETLAERIARGPIPLSEALLLFRQIALALEAAHAKGIVHRDLKPANVKITPEGQPKLLDFGLGKAFGARNSAPTSEPLALSVEGTVTGLILGTASYMSPEQARGQEVDRRTDIWSFGCVLYEALTGRKAFPGANFSESVAAILERPPDWTALPAQTPAPLLRLLRRCLEKDPEHRLHDIGDARLEIEEASSPPPAAKRMGRRSRWRVAVASLVALVALAGWLWTRRAPVEVAPGPDAGPGKAGRRLGEPEAYRAYLREANTRWRQSYERERGRAPGSEPYHVYVVTRRPPTLTVIDGVSHAVLASIPVGNRSSGDVIVDMALSPDGSRSYVVNQHQDAVLVVDNTTRARTRARRGGAIHVRADPLAIAMRPDGKRAYVTAADGYVSVIDTNPASPTFQTVLSVPDGDAITVGRGPYGLAFSPDGGRLYVANGLSDSVSVIDTMPGSPSHHRVLGVPVGAAIPVGQEPHGVTMSADGRLVYVADSFSDTVSVIDADPASARFHTVIATIAVKGHPIDLAPTPDGTRIYVVTMDSHSVAMIDTATRTLTPARIAVRETPVSIALGPDGSRAYVTNLHSRDVSVIDTDPLSPTFHTVLATIPVGGQAAAVAVGPTLPTRPPS